MRYISMHISPINNYKNNYTTFKSVNRYVRLNDGRFYQTFTQFFRTDVKWSDFVNFLENKYKKIYGIEECLDFQINSSLCY